MKFLSATEEGGIWEIKFQTGWWFWKKTHVAYGKAETTEVNCATYYLSGPDQRYLINETNAMTSFKECRNAFSAALDKRIEKSLNMN